VCGCLLQIERERRKKERGKKNGAFTT
jgi:hypothetical protein